MYCEQNPLSVVAYFYFDFNDEEKQKPENLLRSLIIQFLMYHPQTPDAATTLFHMNQKGAQQPRTSTLLKTLRQLLNGPKNAYIILDALDECIDQEALFPILKEVREWSLSNVHLLVTSWRVQDVTECLQALGAKETSIQSSLVDADIEIYVCSKLMTDFKLKKWPANIQNEIQCALVSGANGMWVADISWT